MRVLPALSSSAVLQVTLVVSGVVTVPLFLEAFGRDAYGFWAALLGTTAYLSLLNFGVAQTVSSGASRAPVDDPHAVPRLVQRGLAFYARVVAVAIPVAVTLGLACPWSAWFGLDPRYDLANRIAAAAVFATFLIELPFSVFRAALFGAGEIVSERLVAVGVIVLRVGVAVVLATTHPPLGLGVLLLGCANLVGPLVMFALLRKRFPALTSRLPHAEAEDPAHAMRAQSRDFFLLQIAGAIVWSTDALLAGLVLGSSAAAQISAGWRVMSIVLSVGGVIAPTLAPRLTQIWAGGDKARAAALATDAAQVTFAVLLAGTLGAAVAGEAMFLLWLGPGMFVGHPAWWTYCAILVVQAVLLIPDAFVTQAGRHGGYARLTIVEATLKITVSVLLMKWFGVVGLPLGTLVGRCLTTLWVLPREFGEALAVRPSRWLARVILPSLLPAAAFVAVFLAGRLALPAASPATVFGLATVSGVIFLLLYAGLGLPSRVRERLRAIVSRAPA